MVSVDKEQTARMDRIDSRLRVVEEVVIELKAMTKLARPVLFVLAASLGVDILPMLG